MADKPSGAKEKIIEHFQRRLEAWAPECEEIHERIETNEQFMGFATAQWPDADIQRNRAREQPSLSVNNIAPVVQMVTGTEITGRLRARLFPKHPSDFRVVSFFDSALRAYNDETESEHEETSSFRWQFSHGYGCMYSGWDAEMPLGEEGAVASVPMYEMLWDTRARKGNLMDRMGHMRGYWISEDTFTETYGEEAKKALDEARADGSSDRPDNSNSWGAVSSGNWYNSDANEVFFICYEWRERVKVYDVIKVDLGALEAAQAQALTGDADPEQLRALQQQVMQEGVKEVMSKKEFNLYKARYEEVLGVELPKSEFVPRRPWKWHYALIVGDKVYRYGERRTGRPEYHFLTGVPVHERDKTTFIGLVDLMRDGQEWYNRSLQLSLMIAAHAVKGGFIGSDQLGLNADDIQNELAKPGFYLGLPATAFTEPRKFQIVPPDATALRGIEPLAQMGEKAILAPVGLSNTSLGLIDDPRRVSAVTVNSVKSTASLQLAIFMDGVRRYRKEATRQRLALMQRYLDEERLAELVGPEKAYRAIPVTDPQTGQPAVDPQTGEPQVEYQSLIPPKSEWPVIRRFRLSVDEAPSGPTDMVETFEKMIEHGLGMFYLESGMLPWEVWVDLHPPGWLTPDVKDKWLEHIEQVKQAQQAQQQQQQPQPQDGGGAPQQ